MTDDPEMTLEEFRSLTIAPLEAIAALKPYLLGPYAKSEIKDRLDSSLLNAFAETVVTVNRFGSTPKQFQALNSGFWRESHIGPNSSFWERASADVTFSSGNTLKVFGVRFSRGEIAALVATYAPAPSAAAPGAKLVGVEGQLKPVAQADLYKWAQVAIGVYGSALTEPLALRSAKAMFPDSAVSRERVRALLPPRKPGRRPSGEKTGG